MLGTIRPRDWGGPHLMTQAPCDSWPGTSGNVSRLCSRANEDRVWSLLWRHDNGS